MPSLRRALTALRRRLLIHRRVLSAGCLAVLVWAVVSALHPPPPATTVVWTASRDLPGGSVLRADDLRRTPVDPDLVPATALRHRSAALGRTLGAGLGAGEMLTRSALVGPGRLRGLAGRSAIGIRVPDADAAALLRPGDRVDLLATDPRGAADAVRITRDAVVLAVPRASRTLSTASPGRLVVFAVPALAVPRVAAAASSLFITTIWNR